MGEQRAQDGAAGFLGLSPHLGLGVYIVDGGDRVIAANPRALELLRYRESDLVGQDAHELLHRNRDGSPMPTARCPLMDALLSRVPAQGQRISFLCGDGTLRQMDWTAAPCVWNGDDRATAVLFHLTPDPLEVRRAGPLSELDRLALLADTTTTLTATMNEEEIVDRLAGLVLPRLADWVVVDLIDEIGDIWRSRVVQLEGGRQVRHHELEGPMPAVTPQSPLPLSRALRGSAASLAGPEVYQGAPDSGIAVVQAELFSVTGMHSAAIAPIRGAHEVLGALTLGRSDTPEDFDTRDLALLEDITRRAGLAISNSRLYQRQRRVAETMQRHLLPQLPDTLSLRMSARYLPAPDASQVGGDWYDAFTLPDGSAAMAIGDVVGHDLDAAAGMAQVRNMLRALAWGHDRTPSAVVERLDRAMTHLPDIPMATLVLGQVSETEDGRRMLRWTNAGHLPPLLVSSDGQADFLRTTSRTLLLGSGFRLERNDSEAELPPGSTLLLYTDGLIESPSQGIDPGLVRLRRHAAALAHRPLDEFCDLLLKRVRPPDNVDDVALLAVRFPGHS